MWIDTCIQWHTHPDICFHPGKQSPKCLESDTFTDLGSPAQLQIDSDTQSSCMHAYVHIHRTIPRQDLNTVPVTNTCLFHSVLRAAS